MTRRYALWCFLASAFAICAWLMTTTCIDRGFCREVWPATLAVLPYVGWAGMLVIMTAKGPVLYLAGRLMVAAGAPRWLLWICPVPATLFAAADALANVYVWLQVWDNGLQSVLF